MDPFKRYQSSVLAAFNAKNGGCRVDTQAEAEQATVKAFAFGACSGPCEQGRKACQTPDACQIAEKEAFGWWHSFKAWLQRSFGWFIDGRTYDD